METIKSCNHWEHLELKSRKTNFSSVDEPKALHSAVYHTAYQCRIKIFMGGRGGGC